jgi:Tol biopolymer transport system component
MTQHFHPRFSVLAVLVLCLGLACNLTRYTGGDTPAPGLETPSLGQTAESPALTESPVAQEAGTEAPETGVPETEAPEPAPGTPAAGALLVVYTKSGNLWRWQDGEALQLTTTGDAYNPSLSPDGRTVAFLRPAGDFHTELWAIDLDGANERRLVSISDLDAIGGGVRDPSAVAINPYHYAWVPATRSLAFNTQQVFNGPGLSLLDDLNLVDVDSGEITNLFLAGWGGEFVYSPDGSRVAISKPDMIILSNADGSDYLPVLRYDPVLTYSEYRYYAAPLWSLEGDFLRVAIPPVESLAQPVQPTALWKIPAAGGNPLQEGSVLAVPFFEQPLRYSPDLERLAFLREIGEPSENRRELLLATYDGNGEWAYASGALLHFESWSPDGRRFAYILGDEQEAWIGSLDGAPQPLDADRYGVSNLQWIDNSQMIYVVQRGETFELYLRDLKSGALLLDTTTGVPPVYSFIR